MADAGWAAGATVDVSKESRSRTQGPAGASSVSQDILAPFRRVRPKDLSMFLWQLYTMQNAGLPLSRSLATAARQCRNPKLRAAVEGVRSLIEQGASFSEALGRYPRIFPPLVIHMVEVGETGGMLDGVLERLARHQDDEVERRSQLVGAVSYPLVVLVGCSIAVGFLLLFVVPRLMELFLESGIRIPASTQALILFGEFVRHHGMLCAFLPVVPVVLWQVLKRAPAGRRWIDRLKLSLPITGSLVSRFEWARFSHAMAIMLGGGVPVLSALKTGRRILGNVVLVDVIQKTSAAVSEGEPIHEEMGRSGWVPGIVVDLLAVGEETGSLPEMLARVAAFYDREVDHAIRNLTRAVEPILLVVVAAIVAFIAISVFGPISDLTVGIGSTPHP